MNFDIGINARKRSLKLNESCLFDSKIEKNIQRDIENEKKLEKLVIKFLGSGNKKLKRFRTLCRKNIENLRTSF